MKIYLFGTSHGVPEPDRFCSCTMAEVNGSFYFIDMGTQVITPLRRMGKDPEKIRLVAFTHAHGDHVNGVMELLDLCNWCYRSLNPKYIVPNERLIDTFSHFTEGYNEGSRDYDMELLRDGLVYEDENIRLFAYPTVHAPNSHAYVMEAEGKTVIFSGDFTDPERDIPAVISEKDVDLVFCEAAHVNPWDCCRFFDGTTVRHVVFNHVSPSRSGDARDCIAMGHQYLLEVGYDGMEITL